MTEGVEKFEETWQKVHNASNQNQKVALENGEKVIFSAGLDFRNCDTLYFSFLDPIFLYQTFFSESGSGSAKNPDSIRKNLDPDP